MELKEYINIVKGNIKTILFCAIIAMLSAILFSTITPEKYETSLSVFIQKDNSQKTEDFKYDGYYALQSAEIISDDIEKTLKSPQIVNDIYSRASLDGDFSSIKQYQKKFTVNKMSNQYIEISFETKNEEDAKKISSSIIEITEEKINGLKKASEEEISFSLQESKPVTIKKDNKIIELSLLAFVSGTILGFIAVLTKIYFKNDYRN